MVYHFSFFVLHYFSFLMSRRFSYFVRRPIFEGAEPHGSNPRQSSQNPLFRARRPIPRFAKSHPSPAYIERAAKVFVNDGSSVCANPMAMIAVVHSDP